MPPASPADDTNSSAFARFGLWPAWIALACSLALTAVAWRNAREDAHQQAQAEFELRTERLSASLDDKLRDYVQTLRGAAGLFDASSGVSREEWRNYVARLSLNSAYPAIQAVVFAQAVDDAGVDALTHRARRDGVRDFEMHPAGRRGRHVVNVLVEPYAGANAGILGRDMWADPVRREALQRAMDTGAPAITGRVALPGDGAPIPAVILALPVSANRSRGVEGYVLVSIRIADLVRDVMGPGAAGLSLEIRDAQTAGAAGLLHAGAVTDGERPRFTKQESLSVGGRRWSLAYASLPGGDLAAMTGRAPQVLAGGTLASLLLFAVAWSLATTRNRAVRLARQMTASLRESEESFRILIEQAPDAIVVYDVDMARFVDANPRAEELFGCPRQELLAGGPERFYPKEQFADGNPWRSTREAIERALEGGQVTLERTVRSARGRTTRCELRLTPLPARGRRLLRGSYLDITERWMAEDQRRRAEQRDFIIFRTSPMAVAVVRVVDGCFLDGNDAFGRLLGRPRAELIGRTSVETGYWSSVAERERWLGVLRLKGELHEFETVIRNGEGEARTVVMSSSFIDYAGEACIISFMQDVTERNRMQAALRDSEVRFRSIFEKANTGMAIADTDGTVVQANASLAQLLGYPLTELVGMNIARFTHPDDLAVERGYMQEIRTGQRDEYRMDKRYFARSGKVLWIDLLVTVIRDEAGVPVNLIGLVVDITQRKAAEEEIRSLAFYDPLTQLPNRRLMLDRLRHAIVASARHERHGALMLFDLDDFKTLNDTLGHDVGDQFLVEVGRRISSCIREGDTVARLGGDEFVVILEDLDAEATAAMQAENIAVKIQAELGRPYLLELALAGAQGDTRHHHCTSSIGVTLFRGQAGSADELLKRADTAMYQAKAAGRNTLRFYDPAMQAVVAVRAELNADLRSAVREGQFLLHYQPQVDGRGRVVGAEALVRWRHPRRGLVPPGEFIPLAEDNGIILPLGRWVLESACRQLLEWGRQAATAHLTVAVNVSGRQFRQKGFVDEVMDVIGQTGADPCRLKLELTESLLLHDMEDIIDKMAALKAEGVSFALDDFGTGYSSLSYLKRLPLDQLKIDQSFIRDVLSDPNDAAIARTIVALAQSMGLAVIAEGVETEGQRDFLARHGCHAYQGYLFGRPAEAGQLELALA